jgi:hypothetical protein
MNKQDISFSVKKSKSGDPSVVINNIWVHSRYDPAREASLFVSSHELKSARWLVLVGDTLGYLASAFLEKHDHLNIISITPLPDDALHSVSDKWSDKRIYRCSGENKMQLYKFITNTIPDHHVEKIKVLVWPAISRACPSWSSETLKTISETLSFFSANMATIQGFASKHLSNAFFHLTSLSSSCRFSGRFHTELPVVIAASGPGLDLILPLILDYRERFFLCALPSSLQALGHYNLVPDIIINSDPGYWARFHLLEGLSTSASATDQPFLFSSLYGSLPFHSASTFNHRGLFIEYDSPFALNTSTILHIPARGTVAATALDIMLQSSSGPLFFAGLDFSSRDLQTHVKPHTFDKLYFTWSDRYLPSESIRFFRKPSSSHDPLRQYARYFSYLSAERNVFRILSPFSLRNSALQEIEASSFLDFISSDKHSEPEKPSSYDDPDRRNLVNSIISAFDKRLEYLLSLKNQDISALLARSISELDIEEMRLLNLVAMIDASFSEDFTFLRKQGKIIGERILHVGKLNT